MTLPYLQPRRFSPFLALTHVMLVHSTAGISLPAKTFMYQNHLSTKTPYDSRQNIPSINTYEKLRASQPVFTYWLARHGTRWPTKKRMEQIQKLQNVFKHAGHGAQQLHPWIVDWASPFEQHEHLAGHLFPKGSEEMRSMGAAFRRHWPQSSIQDIVTMFDVHATAVDVSLVIVLSESRHCEASIAADTVLEMTLQKARTQDSAKAFMEGLCGGTHTYTDKAGAAGITGHDRHVQINSRDFHGNYTIHAKPKEHDPVLRFFDMCPAYDDYVAKVDAEFLDAWLQQQWAAHIPRLSQQLQVKQGILTGQVVDALWHLCQQEAGLWGITNRSCSLFSSQEAQHLEWVDDVQLFMRKGAASPMAYRMAAPLLADIATSLKAAASSRSASGFTAKLSFAHAETIIPLACLLGLFGPERHQDHKAATQLAQECGTADELHQHAPECAASEIDGVNTQQSMGHSSSSSNTSNASSSAKNSSGCDVNIESSTENSMQGSRQVWVPPIPRPPLSRGWYGSMIAPYGVNIQFVLHRCTDGQVIPTNQTLSVEVLYNGIRVALPSCNNPAGLCTLDAFLEAVQAAGADEAAFQQACHPSKI